MSIRTAIVGPTGYTGLWLIRLLLRHPQAVITYLASRREEETNIAAEFPELLGRCEMACRPIDANAIAAEADVVCLCLPHKAAMECVPSLLDAGLRVVDLSADYRLSDPAVYELAYATPHDDVANLKHAVYGLPELYADAIAEADLVANPGCYPTAATLGIAPLLQRSLVKSAGIVINACSGVTGAGRTPKPAYHFPEVNEGMMAYNTGIHRHQPEIAQNLSRVKGEPVNVLFSPHLIPVNVGILQTIYLDPQDDDVTQDDLYEAFEDAYDDKPFVRVRTDMPNIKYVQNTNFCDLAVRLVGGKVVVFAAIDNMVKGASGQALQNMNLMFDQDEAAGLL